MGEGTLLLGIAPALRAFRHRNYRLFYSGECISLTGLWIQRVAMSWLVYGLTGSALSLGIVDFTGQFTVYVFGTFTGALMERYDLRKVILVCQSLSMVHAFTMALLTLSGVVQYRHVVVLAFLLGVSDAFELPARQAFVPRLVPDAKDLPSAIALNSTLFNGSRLVCPALAGYIIAFVGEGICFALNGLSYSATLAALLMMRMPKVQVSREKRDIAKEYREGLRYVVSLPPLRNAMLGLAFLSLFGMPFMTLMPVFAREVLAGGPQTLGLLMAAMGIGALAGSLLLAARPSPDGLGRTMALACLSLGMFLATFSTSRCFALSAILMLPTGFSLITAIVACNTLVQTLVDEDKRSRVMSLYVAASVGGAPTGSLLAGWAASLFGAPLTIAFCGAFVAILGVVLLARYPATLAAVTEIYRKKGFME